MKVQQNQKNKSKDIVNKFINEAAKKTNVELKGYLDELKKLKAETASVAKQ
jgi:hypothetical protein